MPIPKLQKLVIEHLLHKHCTWGKQM